VPGRHEEPRSNRAKNHSFIKDATGGGLMSDLENKLTKALEVLERASREFKLKQASFEETTQLEALKELIKEQLPHEDSVHTAREAR
jgi:hypothetical protein